MNFQFDVKNIERLMENLLPFATTYAIKIVAAVLVFIIGKWIASKISRLVSKLMECNNVDITLVKFFENLVYYSLMVMVLIAVASQLGINTASFLTIVGAAGLAIGLALKDSLSNLASGVMLILFRPFKVDDYVTANGISGTVISIGLFNTTLHTPDNQREIIPNAGITTNVITNVTANPIRRIDLVIGIGYDDDLLKAKKVLGQILSEEERVLSNPISTIALSELGDHSVNLVVRPWVATGDYWDVYFDLMEAIKLGFDREGISFPFPHRDVRIFENSKLS